MTPNEMRSRLAAQDTVIRHLAKAARRLMDKMAVASVERHTGAFKPELDTLDNAVREAEAQRVSGGKAA